MSIRFSKACKILNVGLTTAVDYLEQIGYTIKPDPNIKIDDDVYKLLIDKFSKDLVQKINADKITVERQIKMQQNHSLTIDVFNLNYNQSKSKKQITNEETTRENDLNSLSNNNLVLLGEIDLALLNANSQPRAKKQKSIDSERITPELSSSKKIYKNPQYYKTRLQISNESLSSKNSDFKIHDDFFRSNETNLKEIWEKFTDVQEQMIRLRSVPVSIIPDSAKLLGEKLILLANEDDITDAIVEEIATNFQLSANELNLEDGYFYADIDKSQSLKQDEKNKLSERAASNFINFQPYPIVDGYIQKIESPFKDLQNLLNQVQLEHNFDKRGRLQMSIDDLLKLIETIDNKQYKINFPETASIILPISPNKKYYIEKKYPFLTSANNQNVLITNTITTTDVYFSGSIYENLRNEIDLKLCWYKFIFKVSPVAIGKFNSNTSPHILPAFNKDNNTFCFHTNIDKDYNIISELSEDEKYDFDFKYSRLKKFFDSFFGSQNVSFTAVFSYSYNNSAFDSYFLDELNKTQIDNGSININEHSMSIGIDFNWRNVHLNDLVAEIKAKYPFAYFNLYENHKCNIDFQIQDLPLDEAEQLLREKFPSIKTIRDDKNGLIYFYQEYQNTEQKFKIKQILEAELSDLQSSNPNVFNYKLYDNPINKEKYFLEIDKQSKKESQASALKELRGSDFCVNKNYFGKLFRVNYPELIFDISGNEFEQTKQLFESHLISSIEPNLTGDLEKVFRLKNSLNNIIKGTNLQNPNLKEFIFDAGKAKKIENIDLHTNSQSETCKELEYHLLNTKINESQKQAIIKTLLAEDLALIQGPPGTGKSTAIAEIIWQHIRKNPKERILLTSETNLAVDNAIDRIVNSNHNLVKPIRFGDEEKLEMEGRQFSIEVMKRWVLDGKVEINSEDEPDDEESATQKLILLNWIENIKNRAKIESDLETETLNLWVETLSNPSKEIRQIFYNNYIKNCNLIGATCSSIGERNTKKNPTSFFKSYCEVFGKVSTQFNRNDEEYTTYNGNLKFSTIIQDESSKATPAELSLPLIYGKKNIIIGDHRQLPPMLDKEEFKLSLDFLLERTENKDEKKKIQKLKSFVINNFNEMEISHFERLFDKIDPSLKGIFNKQYRMHPDINEVIKQFYINDGGLECGLINPTDLGVNDPNMHNSASRYHGIEIDELISKNNHVIWIDTNSPELLDGTSRINYGEVDAIKDVLTKFRNSDSFQQYQSFWKNPDDQQIGIISFYGKQIKLLRNLRNEFKDIPIRVSTVDRFQGMERNIIIVSMVRSNRIASDKNQKADFNLYGKLGFTEQNDLGFAQSPNRLNVALSRAKRLLIIVGNSDLFKQKEIYKNVYQTIVENPNGRIIKYETL